MIKNFIKISTIYLLIIILNIFISNYSYAVNTKIYIEDTIKYSNEENVTINICAENMSSNITILGLHIKYDSSKLEFVKAKAGKDLDATMKLAQEYPSDSKIGIAMISMNGFQKDGIYYSLTFKVLDDSKDIPVDLILKEASDSKGNDVNVQLSNGKIIINNVDNNDEEIEVSPQDQKIETYEINEFDEVNDTLEKIILDNCNIELLGNDEFIYEIEDDSIIEVLEDGTIIPIKDGITNIRILLNSQVIGNANIKIEDGKISKIKFTDEELNFVASATTEKGTVKNTSNYQKNFEEVKTDDIKSNDDEIIGNIIAVIMVLIIIVFLILKKYIKKNKNSV